MASSSILLIKRAKSIDFDVDSVQFTERYTQQPKVQIFDLNIPQLRKIFNGHSWSKKNGYHFISISEFMKIAKNLRILPDLLKTFTLKAMINDVLSKQKISLLNKC